MGQRSNIQRGSETSLSSYIAVMGILNAMLKRVCHSLPQIQEAIGMLPEDAAVLHTGNGQSSVPR